MTHSAHTVAASRCGRVIGNVRRPCCKISIPPVVDLIFIVFIVAANKPNACGLRLRHERRHHLVQSLRLRAFETLLAASAVHASVSALSVVAECAVRLAACALLAVAALRLTLILVEVGSLLVLIEGGSPLLLIQAGTVLLIEVGLLATALLAQVSLVGPLLPQVSLAGPLPCQVVRIFVSELRLIQILVEMGLGEVVGAIVGIQIIAIVVVPVKAVGVDVIPVDVVRVDVIAIDVVDVRVVVVRVAVVIIPINEGV